MAAVTENVQQPLRYMARELDPLTGLYHVRNRWYDPVANRFVSEDPIGLAGGINTYAYASNNPMNALDPWGLQSCYVIWNIVWEVTHQYGRETSRREVSRRAAAYWCEGGSTHNLRDLPGSSGGPDVESITPRTFCSALKNDLALQHIVEEVRARALKSGVEHGAWLVPGPGGELTAIWARPGTRTGMSSGPRPPGGSIFLHGHPNFGVDASGGLWRQSLSPRDHTWALNHPGIGIVATAKDTTSMLNSDWQAAQVRCPRN
jgi:RHS repeat-associated protein